MNEDVDVGVGLEVDYMAKDNEKAITHSSIFELIMKKSKNKSEYKKYAELVGMLMLSYNKRLGSISAAEKAVYELISESNSVNDLVMHYNALMEEEKANADKSAENAKARIANMLLNDYKRRFGEGKKEAYNVLVLQSWINKVEGINELTILMDNILNVRDKLGNSWDYEVHIIPLLVEKAFSTDELMDYANAITNLIVGLGRKLKDNYLAVMTGVKVLEYANSPTVIKSYIRDMVKENNKKIDQLNTQLAMINSNTISKVKNIARIRALNQQIAELHLLNEELMKGIDPKELMLEGTKR
ncbi:MAG: hypothetical protein RXO35_02635 [Candidatus Micrarchaeota archaeon]